MTALLIGGQVLPFILLASGSFLEWSPLTRALIGAGVACSLLPRLLACWRFRQPVASVFLHPAAVLLLEIIQWTALARELAARKSSWKGRAYPAPGAS